MIRSDFIAELHCSYGQVGIADTHLIPTLGSVFNELTQDGWLCARKGRPGNGFEPIVFKFEYLEETADRIHYQIKCRSPASDGWARLEQGLDGWLGLYGTNLIGAATDLLDPPRLLDRLQGSNFWKIETLQEWDGELASAEAVDFYLRDAQGYRVSNIYSSPSDTW